MSQKIPSRLFDVEDTCEKSGKIQPLCDTWRERKHSQRRLVNKLTFAETNTKTFLSQMEN